MTDYDAWRIVRATCLHFSSKSYDAFKFNFKGGKSIQRKHFDDLPETQKYFAKKLANKLKDEKSIQTYAFTNIVKTDTKWFAGMSFGPYFEYIKFIQNFSYQFKQRISHINMPLNDYLTSKDGQFSEIIVEYLRDNLPFEAVIIIDSLTNFLSHNNKTCTDTLVWPELYLLFNKSKPFILRDIDKIKAKKILKEHFFSLHQS